MKRVSDLPVWVEDCVEGSLIVGAVVALGLSGVLFVGLLRLT